MTSPSIASNLRSEFTAPLRHKTNLSSPGRWLLSHFLPYWSIGLLMVVGALGNAGLAAVVPVIIGDAFDTILEDHSQTQSLVGFAWAIVISQTIRGVLQLSRNYGAEWLAQITERNIREELFTSLLGKGMTFHSLQPIGDTMARATNDVREINYMYSPGLNLVIGSFTFLIMPLIAAPRFHTDLVLVPIIFLVAYILALWQYLGELYPITDKVRGAFGKMNTRLAEAIDGIETVKGNSQEVNEVKRFNKNARRFRDAFIYQGNVEARFLPLLLLGLAEGFGLLHALILYQQELLSVGDVIGYFGVIQMLGFPTFVSLFAYSQVSLGFAGARRVLDLIILETELDQNTAGYSEEMQGAIEFRGVTFAYKGNEPALQDISLKIQPGKTVAIVGQTGSGKTSLAKLVNRTYDTTEGEVLVDGVDVREWQMETLRRSISIIEQDIFLFSRTIAENIAFGNPEATQEQIEAVAKTAQAHDFISEFKEGYQTVIGERGVTLSGGQRQRLALARAFLTDPHILILDDSTSSIDSATEDEIQRAIFTAAQGRTTLIITHRLSQIRWADLIVVLRQGRIAAVGTHDELLASSEAYQRIFSE
ncbi:MAG: ABC transporter ATP-binding protein [Chloroflexi bacterium]|nr:ABC transporter ATP-binding protein [Chloroflexota bacterium]